MLIPFLEGDDLGFDTLEFAHDLGVSFVDLYGLILTIFEIKSLIAIFGRQGWPPMQVKSLHLWSISIEYLEDPIQQDPILVIDLILLH